MTEKANAAISDQSPIRLGLAITALCGVVWFLSKWSDLGDKYQTKELATAQVQSLQLQISAVKETLSAQIDALRAEIRAADRGGK